MEDINNTDYEIPKTPEEVYKEQERHLFPNGIETGGQEENRVITCEFHEYTKAEIERCNGNLDFYENSYNRHLYSLYPENIEADIYIEAEKRLDAFQNRIDERMEVCKVQGSYDVRENEQLVEAMREEVRREKEEQYSYLAAFSAHQDYTDNYGISEEQKPDIDLGSWVDAEAAAVLEIQKQQIIRRFIEGKNSGELEYLVRGAPITCICGSHTRHLDMYHSHGVYVNGKAVAFEEDCLPDINISYFGHCNSPKAELTETISLKKGGAVNIHGAYLEEPDDAIRVAIKCIPAFEGKWQNAHEETLIAGKGERYTKALTTASYLICRHGGLIYPLTSGQLDESYYHAPFMAYPFDDFGSEAFYHWCEQNNICPALPGEQEYYDWYKDKLDTAREKHKKLLQENEKWVEEGGPDLMMSGDTPQTRLYDHQEYMAKLYEECLDGAYMLGLDTMSREERQKYIQLKEEYADSILLNRPESEEVRERYSGLRLNLGSNGR